MLKVSGETWNEKIEGKDCKLVEQDFEVELLTSVNEVCKMGKSLEVKQDVKLGNFEK